MATKRRVKRILNVVPSRETERDWRFENAEKAGLLAAAPAKIPASKNLRETWWKVGDQGSTGSCVGWASGDGVLRWHFTKAGQLNKNEMLSVRFLWMASKETDEFESEPSTFIEAAGTSLKAALAVARKYGVVRKQVLQFDSGAPLYQGEEETFYSLAAQRRIASYYNVSLSRGHTLEDWRVWIATKGPLLVRLDVDSTWYAADSNKGNLDLYKRPSRPAGHAVCLVGYTPDRFIVRNSWGTTWGDKGFGYASLAYTEAAFTEAYGVTL